MKTVLVTGASRGIGKAIATKFAQNGYNVIIHCYQNEQLANELAQSLQQFNIMTLVVKADISNFEEIKNMVELSLKKFGKIDVLVNNAGVSMTKLVQDHTKEDIEKVVSTNTLGCIYTTKEVCPNMISNKYGKIINISSIWGLSGASMESVYSASKGATISFSKALAKELAPSNITVNCVCPGVIDTDMLNEYSQQDKLNLASATPAGRLGTPQDVANLVHFLASDEANFITGQVISVDGGFNL